MNPRERKIQPSEVEIKWAESAKPFKSLTDEILRDHFIYGEAEVFLRVDGNENALAFLNKLRTTDFGQYLLPEGAVFELSHNIRTPTYKDNEGREHYEDEEPQPTASDQNLVAIELNSHHERPYRYNSNKQAEYFEYRHLAVKFLYESQDSAHQGYQIVVVARTSEDAKEGIMAPKVEVVCGMNYREDGQITSETGHTLYNAESDTEKEKVFLTFATEVFDFMKQQNDTAPAK